MTVGQLAVDAVGVTRTFGSVRAVDDISVRVAVGIAVPVAGLAAEEQQDPEPHDPARCRRLGAGNHSADR